MFALSGIALLVIIMLVSVMVALIVYTILHNKRMKRAVEEEKTDGAKKKSRAWPSPWIFVLAFTCAVLLIYSVVTTIAMGRSTTNKDSRFAGWHYDALEMVKSDEIEDSKFAYYASAAETKDLEGYSVEEVTDGDFTYLLFEQEPNEMNALEPQFLIFVKYTGDNNYFSMEWSFTTKGSSDMTSCYDTTQEWNSDYVLFAGNLGDYSAYQLNLYMYEDEYSRDQDCLEYKEEDAEMFETYAEKMTLVVE